MLPMWFATVSQGLAVFCAAIRQFHADGNLFALCEWRRFRRVTESPNGLIQLRAARFQSMGPTSWDRDTAIDVSAIGSIVPTIRPERKRSMCSVNF